MAWLYVIGRLKAVVSPERLQTQLSLDLQQWLRSERELSKEDLAALPKQHIQVTAGGTGVSSFRSNSKDGLYLLSAASLLVLLIACANLANLLLARSAARQQQTALRLALGASRLRLIRAVLVESVLLSVIGGAAGVSVAYAGTKVILLIVFRGATDAPVHATPSLPVLGFAFLLSLLTGVMFGIAPAWIGTRASLSVGVRGSRIAPHASSNTQKVLVVVQAALSIVLLTVAGLVTQSLRNLEKTDLGFQIQGRLLANINFEAAGYKPEQLLPLYGELQRRLEQIPGVRSASLSLNSPLNLCCVNLNIGIGGRTDKWIEDVNVFYDRVSPHYFETIGTPVVRGRTINDQDTETSQHVAVVDEAFARKFFPNEDAIGKSFGLSLPGHGYDYRIVGVVRDAKYKSPAVAASPTMFLPFTQMTPYQPTGYQRLETATLYAQSIQLSVVGAPEEYEKAFLDALASIDPNLSPVNVTSYSEQVAIQFNRERLIARLTGLFSLLALALASVGLYGVTGYNVARRTNEIGTRMALGADRSNIVIMVIRGALLQVAIGLCIGLPIAMLIGRYLAHELYEIGRFDPLVLGGATVVLCVCAIVAGFLPAWRAASIDPMIALRYE
jgi:predicted permease